MKKKGLLKSIFSVENEGIHKVTTVLGIRFKVKNKYKELLGKIAIQERLLKKQDGILKHQEEQLSLYKKDFCKQKKCLEDTNKQLKDKYRQLYGVIKRTTPWARLNNFEVHLVEHCNLNCQGCNHYSPLAEKEFMDISVFRRDFARMAELTKGDVNYINLLGGEPLLHENLLDFFPIAREYFPNPTINLVSNGILLSTQSEKFWEDCKKYNITICVTKYPLENINWDKIEEKINSYGLELVYWGVNKDPIKYSWIFPMDIEGSQDATTNFLDCRDANKCIFLRDGKLFTCVEPPNIHHFNKFFGTNIPVTDRDYIDIYKAKDINEILDFLAKPIPFCKYCNVKARKYHIPWDRSKKDIKEWTL